ncbi:uncharacterized protein EAF02_009673 [Botrytis sinoallii]|uniref:uncharacterized protein n=1 Tax=Botrytis sinoallii TaxID=1463999 RepID=UPI0019018EED|nr:uncharacterized protein EAF02_009673 [Botrytis sinoallii]KAF7867482.1 hypothetical protein EAF02_009673 [Botrytis sinoallii]
MDDQRGNESKCGKSVTEYARWCAKVVREEGWVDFSEGSVEGAEQRGNGRAIDLMVSGEMFRADRILDRSEESMTFANESEDLDLLQATDALAKTCARQLHLLI